MLAPGALLHRNDIAELTRLASRDLEGEMGRTKTRDALAFRDELTDVLQQLINLYAPAAAAVGADWYDDLRERAEVRGRFQAIVADLPDLGRAPALAGWAVEPLFGAEPDAAATIARASGGLQRIVFDADRRTVAGSSIADPAATGWQRTGSGECAFCRMLIGRGAVYSEATADFASHDHCRCVAVPAFGGQPVPVKPYTPSTRGTTEKDRARVRAYLAAHPQK